MAMKSLGQKVAERREELGMTQAELAEATGMSQQGIQSIEAGNSARPRKLREIAKALKKPESFFLGEDEDDGFSDEEMKVVENAVSIVGEVAAGVWREFDQHGAPDPEKKIPMVPVMVGGTLDGLFALRVRGNSMDQVVGDGLLVVCRDIEHSHTDPMSGDLVVVERRRMQDGLRETTIKRYRKTKDGFELHPESSDPRWKPIKIRTNKPDPDMEIHLIGYVLLIASEPARK